MLDLPLLLINYIIENRLAKQKDVDIFKDYDPPQAKAIVVYEYAGSNFADFTSTSVRSIQVVVKDPDIRMAKELSAQILALFYKETGLIFDIAGNKLIIYIRNTPIKIAEDRVAFNMGITTNNFKGGI